MRIRSSSDYSSADTSLSSIVARESTYSDLDLLFAPNPTTGDINPLRDVEAVKRSIKNLILTKYNERPFQPEIGSGINNLLFEPADPITIHEIEQTIKRVISNFEPRVNLISVNAISLPDENSYDIDITFQIISNELLGSVAFTLERLR